MFELDTLSTLVAATLVLLLGRKLVQSVSLLKKYTIPEPVAGGLLVAIALLVLKKSVGWEVNFDMTLRDPLMLAFFATIGLNANLASLRKGGTRCWRLPDCRGRIAADAECHWYRHGESAGVGPINGADCRIDYAVRWARYRRGVE
ncbi:glutamate permease [Salmonella enterica subsp. arizonae]|uniref:Glutamate permease n=1 Tax=Salmonella enterica subsp. arizonae TaxID=59203 RepID=A0A379TQL9_SALER|nr:glutamate permease [Salmonella enterica subsp. arizonae]